MKKILLAISLIFSLSQADSFHRNRNFIHQPHRVVAKTVYINNHNRRRHRNDRIAGALIGGIIGGILGNQIGYGDGRAITTVGGIVIGSALGSNLVHRRYKRRVVYYRPHHRWRRMAYYRPHHRWRRFESYRPHHRWRRMAYVNRDRFYEREYETARRYYR